MNCFNCFIYIIIKELKKKKYILQYLLLFMYT